MAKQAVDTTLEAIVGDADAPDPRWQGRPRRRSRSWPILVLALACVSLLIAFPVRTRFAESEFARVERQWALVDVLNHAHVRAVDDVERLASTDDEAAATGARHAVSAEHAARLARVAAKIRRERTPDRGLRRLRSSMLETIGADIEDLRHDPWIVEIAARRAGPTDRLVDAQARRWHHNRTTLSPSDPAWPDFSAATKPTITMLSRYLDEPTGVRVVGMTNGVIADIDIDASTTTTKHFDEFDDLNPDGQSDVTLARDGYIVLKTRIGVFTVVNGLDQPPRFIGMASSIFASSRGDAFWTALTTRTTDPRLVTVSQIDGNGSVLTQPTSTAPPDNGDWDRSAGTAAKMPGVATGYVLDKHGDMRAVITFGAMSQPTLSLYTPEHGSRLIEDPPGLQAVTCEFSPDGRHLAILYGSTTARLGIIDIATGGLTMVDGSAGLRARRLHWSPKGDRVFVDASAGPRPLTTYRMGDTRMRQLRYIGSVPLEWVVVPARG